jgi:hypothetical protein
MKTSRDIKVTTNNIITVKGSINTPISRYKPGSCSHLIANSRGCSIVIPKLITCTARPTEIINDPVMARIAVRALTILFLPTRKLIRTKAVRGKKGINQTISIMTALHLPS